MAQAPPPRPNQPAPSGPAAQPQGQSGEQPPEHPPADHFGTYMLFTVMPSMFSSMVFHTILFIVLALITVGTNNDARRLITAEAREEEEPPEVEDIEDIEEPEPVEAEITSEIQTPNVEELAADVFSEEVEVEAEIDDIDSAPAQFEITPLGDYAVAESDVFSKIGTSMGTGITGRGAKSRGALVAKYGGTKESEAAVQRALKWIAYHQISIDGGWNFDHRIGDRPRLSPNPGSAKKARIGATAMAVLPFLGAGQTHREGDYKKTVDGGLGFLIRSMKPKGNMGELREAEGNMYSHGLAAITLCEAYAMTHDKRLMGPAQASLNYIVYAQDPVGGGWRYSPKQAGDTSVVGWQLMALKSGHMAYLAVPPQTVKQAYKFLDSVQADYGGQYGYTAPATGRDATTAVGLLCRMYLGWKRDHPGLQNGIEYLDKRGPSKGNMYYNYYATQVMKHSAGVDNDDPRWKKWNVKMRDWLVAEQVTKGKVHEGFGSWHMKGDHGADRGGRLYCTSMATMILEVYYRHMPIYQKAASEDEFKL